MIILSVDIETTGLDPRVDVITELGAVLWDTDRRCPVALFNDLNSDARGKLNPETSQITGIIDDDIERDTAISLVHILTKLHAYAEEADYILAHNAQFEINFLKAACDMEFVVFPTNPWVCSILHVPYPAHVKSRQLSYIASDFRMINYWSHRAIFDAMTGCYVCDQVGWDKIIAYRNAPKLLVVGHQSFTENHLAKAAGFLFDADLKRWTKTMTEDEYQGLELPFNTSTRPWEDPFS